MDLRAGFQSNLINSHIENQHLTLSQHFPVDLSKLLVDVSIFPLSTLLQFLMRRNYIESYFYYLQILKYSLDNDFLIGISL